MKLKTALFLALLAFFAFVRSAETQGTIYYVDDTGGVDFPTRTCATAQNIATPMLTIRSAVFNCGNAGAGGAGKTVYIRDGTYNERISSFDYTIPSGSSGNPFVIAGYPNERPIVRDVSGIAVVSPASVNAHASLVEFYDTVSYVTVRNLELNGGDRVIDVVRVAGGLPVGVCPACTHPNPGAHHIIVEDVEVYGGFQDGFLWGGDDGLLRNSDIHDNSLTAGAGDHGYGIYSTGDRMIIDGNFFHHNARYGLHVYPWYGDQNLDVIVRNNFIHDNGQVELGEGLIIAGTRMLVYNNTFWDEPCGALRIDQGFTGSVYNNTLWNNGGVVCSNPAAGVSIYVHSNSGNPLTFKNNIIIGHASSTYAIDYRSVNGTGLTNFQDHNICDKPNDDTGVGTFGNCIAGTLGGVAFVSTTLDDFRIMAASTARNLGATLTEFNTDFLGNTRPEPGGTVWDIGAHEFATGTSRSTTITETFNGTATNPLTTPNWQQRCTGLAGTPTMVYSTSNRVTATAPTDPQEYACARWIGPGVLGSNHWVSYLLASALVGTTTYRSKMLGVCVRMSADADALRDGYCSDILDYTTDGIFITETYKVLDGVQFYLTSTGAVAWASLERLEMEAENNVITTLKDGTAILSTVDSALPTGGVGIIGAGAADIIGDTMTAGYLGVVPTTPDTISALTGGNLGLTEYHSSAGATSVQSTTMRTGAGAIQVNPTTTGTGHFQLCPPGTDGAISFASCRANGDITKVSSFYFRYGTKPASLFEEIHHMEDDAGGDGIALALDSAGKLRVYKYDGTLASQCGATGGTVLAQDTWYLVEFQATKGATGAFDLRLAPDNGTASVTEITGTCDSGTGNFEYLDFGKSINTNGQTVNVYYDDVLYASSFVGPHKVVNLVPNAAGTYSVWNNGTGATFAEVDDFVSGLAKDDDTTYIAETGGGSNSSSFNVASSAASGIAPGSTILGLKAWAFLREVTADTAAIGFVAATNIYETTQAALTSTYTHYAFNSSANPNTLLPWTIADLDAIEVLLNSVTSSAVRATAVGITVVFDDTGIPTVNAHPYYYSLLGAQ